MFQPPLEYHPCSDFPGSGCGGAVWFISQTRGNVRHGSDSLRNTWGSFSDLLPPRLPLGQFGLTTHTHTHTHTRKQGAHLVPWLLYWWNVLGDPRWLKTPGLSQPTASQYFKAPHKVAQVRIPFSSPELLPSLLFFAFLGSPLLSTNQATKERTCLRWGPNSSLPST